MEKARRIYLNPSAHTLALIDELAARERRDPTNVCSILIEWALMQLSSGVGEGTWNLSTMIGELSVAAEKRGGEIAAAVAGTKVR